VSNLLERIGERDTKVAVIGLGHVGLPLALRAAAAGFRVVGIDIDEEKVEKLAGGSSYLLDVPSEQVATQVESSRFRATTDADAAEGADVILICVPTPLRHDLPDMSYIEAAGKEVARILRAGMLVILESTTYPGTTEDFLREILESSGLKAGTDFFLGFSPERIDPGNPTFGVNNVPKIIGGINEQSTKLMETFYGAFIDRVIPVSSPKVAEMVKLLENTYRHVNIALANEIAILCHDLGIDVWEVIDAAATKPFGFEPFFPGPGWGGHCIPVDPAYLSWRVRQMGETARFVELARQINRQMPAYVVGRIAECLNEEGKSLRSAKVLILGVAYKPDVADVRESPAIEIVSRLLKAGAEVAFHDPYIEELVVGETSIRVTDLSDERLQSADIIVVVTNHSSYDWRDIANHARLILDTRNALKGVTGRIIRL
jgi:UDP-N-acetyl-D-glucosamine dehydrogenase